MRQGKSFTKTGISDACTREKHAIRGIIEAPFRSHVRGVARFLSLLGNPFVGTFIESCFIRHWLGTRFNQASSSLEGTSWRAPVCYSTLACGLSIDASPATASAARDNAALTTAAHPPVSSQIQDLSARASSHATKVRRFCSAGAQNKMARRQKAAADGSSVALALASSPVTHQLLKTPPRPGRDIRSASRVAACAERSLRVILLQKAGKLPRICVVKSVNGHVYVDAAVR